MVDFNWVSILSLVLVAIISAWTIIDRIRKAGRSITGKDISISSYGDRIKYMEAAAQVIPTLNQIRGVVETHKDAAALFTECLLLLLDKHRADNEALMEAKYQELVKFVTERLRKQ